jgi:hypothetical protein
MQDAKTIFSKTGLYLRKEEQYDSMLINNYEQFTEFREFLNTIGPDDWDDVEYMYWGCYFTGGNDEQE